MKFKIIEKSVYLFLIILFISCGNDKKIELSQSNISIQHIVSNYSSVYFFFDVKENDTLVDVNRNNTISSTNWVFNVDKRFSLHQVIPEIIKLQTKKSKSAHADSLSLNYFSYMNSNEKKLVFLPFNKFIQTSQLPFSESLLQVYTSKFVWNNIIYKNQDLAKVISEIEKKKIDISVAFHPNCSFEQYLQTHVLLTSKDIKFIDNQIFISK